MWQQVEFTLRPRKNGFHLVTDEIMSHLPTLPKVGLINRSIMHTYCEIVPAVDQIETHVFRQQDKMHGQLTEHRTVHESWSPLACRKNNIFHNPLLTKIASAHGKTAARVALSWLLQRDIPVIPKSTHEERMRENLAITDFTLSSEEMSEIATLDQDHSLFNWW